MANQLLNQQIQALQSALSSIQSVDADTRKSLVQLQRDIGRVVEHHSDVPVTERLEELAVRFEADHPAVGTAIRQAIDALSKAGI
jgi:chaperonin cofactor prefoldin